MPIPIDALEAEALNLPRAHRVRLIHRLIASLESDPEWAAAWSAEADRREAHIASGASSWVSGQEAIERLRVGLA